MPGGYLGKGVEGKQEQVTELGELVTYVSYQQVPLSRRTTTFCLFPRTSCPTAIYIYQNMRLSEKNEVC